MTVMVDELIAWPQKAKPGARRWFGDGKQSCHMTTDGDIDELHAFATKIGMKREWFQEHRLMPHYDLTPSRRERALRAGAVFVPGKEQARRRIEARKAEATEGGRGGVMASDGYLVVKSELDGEYFTGSDDGFRANWSANRLSAKRFQSQDEFRRYFWRTFRVRYKDSWGHFGNVRFVRVRPRKEAA